jgi:hypothetical protein
MIPLGLPLAVSARAAKLAFKPAGGRPASSGNGGHPSARSASPVDASAAALDRRTLMILSSGLVASYLQLHAPSVAQAVDAQPSTSGSRGLDAYIRKKQLDPLDTYVPLVLEAREQLARASDLVEADVRAARQLLRSGPLGGLRDNVRAIGEYALKNGSQVSLATDGA